MLVHEDGRLVGTIGGGRLEHEVIRAAMVVIDQGAPTVVQLHLSRDLGMCCGGAVEVYVEPILKRPRLILCGAGHVAEAVAPIAKSLDFDLFVVDERDELNTAERFPEATRLLDDPREVVEQLQSDVDTYWLVVTHDHLLDEELGATLLQTEAAWIGMIGSVSKITRFFLRWRQQGIPTEAFRRLSAPVGLDLGAETPQEIAVSIAGELVRVRRQAKQTPLPLSQSRDIPARQGPAIPPLWEDPDAP